MRRFFLLALAASAVANAAAAQPPKRDGYITTSDAARLYYRIAGRGADTVIAIHGGPGVDLESIAGDFGPLEGTHTVIYYDQRGAGRSELPTDTTRLAVSRQIADLDEVRTHFGLKSVILVAHSYGPLLAASYAIAHPANVSKMVFFGPVPPRRGEFWKRLAINMRPRLDSASNAQASDASRRLGKAGASGAEITQACNDLWTINLRPRLAEPARTQKLIKSDLCASDPAGIAYGLTTTNRVVMASYGEWDLRPALRTLQIPTLIVHGEDEAIPMDLVQEWAASLPKATLVKIPRAAHFTYVERPELVWPVVETFVGDLENVQRAVPQWVSALISKLEREPVANPPASITRFLYRGDTVYYLPPRCCDIPSTVFSKAGESICAADGGMSGGGDDRCADFYASRREEKVVWRDTRRRGR